MTLRDGLGIILGVMSVNGKTADQMREEFYAALRQERAERLVATQRLAEEMRERDQQWKKITGECETAEEEQEGVADLGKLDKIGGMPVIEVYHPLKFAKQGQDWREYAGFIQCPDAIVLLEFKRRLTHESVQKFLDKQLREFPRDVAGLFGKMFEDKTLYGAVVGVAVDDDAKQLAEDNGLFAIRIPANRRAEMLNDEGKAR